MGERQVHVLADDVEQAREPLARLGQRARRPRARAVTSETMPCDEHAAVGPRGAGGAVPQDPGDAVEPEQAVGDLGVLAARAAGG